MLIPHRYAFLSLCGMYVAAIQPVVSRCHTKPVHTYTVLLGKQWHALKPLGYFVANVMLCCSLSGLKICQMCTGVKVSHQRCMQTVTKEERAAANQVLPNTVRIRELWEFQIEIWLTLALTNTAAMMEATVSILHSADFTWMICPYLVPNWNTYNTTYLNPVGFEKAIQETTTNKHYNNNNDKRQQ